MCTTGELRQQRRCAAGWLCVRRNHTFRIVRQRYVSYACAAGARGVERRRGACAACAARTAVCNMHPHGLSAECCKYTCPLHAVRRRRCYTIAWALGWATIEVNPARKRQQAPPGNSCHYIHLFNVCRIHAYASCIRALHTSRRNRCRALRHSLSSALHSRLLWRPATPLWRRHSKEGHFLNISTDKCTYVIMPHSGRRLVHATAWIRAASRAASYVVNDIVS